MGESNFLVLNVAMEVVIPFVLAGCMVLGLIYTSWCKFMTTTAAINPGCLCDRHRKAFPRSAFLVLFHCVACICYSSCLNDFPEVVKSIHVFSVQSAGNVQKLAMYLACICLYVSCAIFDNARFLHILRNSAKGLLFLYSMSFRYFHFGGTVLRILDLTRALWELCCCSYCAMYFFKIDRMRVPLKLYVISYLLFWCYHILYVLPSSIFFLMKETDRPVIEINKTHVLAILSIFSLILEIYSARDLPLLLSLLVHGRKSDDGRILGIMYPSHNVFQRITRQKQEDESTNVTIQSTTKSQHNSQRIVQTVRFLMKLKNRMKNRRQRRIDADGMEHASVSPTEVTVPESLDPLGTIGRQN